MRGQATRPHSADLGVGPQPAAVLHQLADEPGLACLWGCWLGDSTEVLIMSRPIAVSADAAVLDDLGSLDPGSLDPGSLDPGSGAADGFVGGGWVGWLGYDAPPHLGFYDHLLRFDERTSRWSFEALWSQARADALAARRDHLQAAIVAAQQGDTPAQPLPSGHDRVVGAFAGPDRERHLAAVEEAIGLIRAGEIYQANVCTRLTASFSAAPGVVARIFADAATTLRPRFGALVDGGDRTVLSLSPELFLRRVGDEVTSSPIKGTWARADAGDSVDRGAAQLRDSAKDVAENIMIVDLVRNDLGRVCRPGTVRASELLGVRPAPGVWHLVSTVQGRLRPSVGDADLLAAAFPPGSVTGAPKLRAMRAIADIEDGPRGVYTGAIGIAGPSAGLALSVAIRTFEITGERIALGVGGGITADSVPELEWRECAQKAGPLVRGLGSTAPVFDAVAAAPAGWQLDGGVFESLLAVDGVVLALADHLARLERSTRELYGFAIAPAVAPQVRAAVAGSAGRWAIRVTASPAGAVTVTAAAAGVRPSSSAMAVIVRPGVWRHKWADRSWAPPVDALFVGADGCVLETTRGNVFLLAADGRLTTPPQRDDLLPGVTRRAILDLARDRSWPVRLASFGVAAFDDVAAAFWASSVSGVVAITEVDGRPVTCSDFGRARLTEIATALGFS